MASAFKEWALVCEALGAGNGSLIVRKGGIAEGREGFSFREREFLLFPTWFHEQLARTRLPETTELPEEPAEDFEIRYAAVVEWTGFVDDLAKVRALETLHILRDSVVEERFRYDGANGLHLAFCRIYRLDPPRKFKMEKRYGGCRSWVDVPEPEGCAMVSVISDEEHLRRKSFLEGVLGISSAIA